MIYQCYNISICIVTQTGEAIFWHDNNLNNSNVKHCEKIHDQDTTGPNDSHRISVQVTAVGIRLHSVT